MSATTPHWGRSGTAVLRRRDDWRAQLLAASDRRAERAGRCARWTDRGVERCRRWAREGARRPGEMAPPSWFFIALPFGTASYRVTGGTARAWYGLTRVAFRITAGALSGLLTAVALLLPRP
ncbi:hypothetical protein ACWEQL_26775 [Kitasatospora sp. NPDC004240]